MSTRTRRPAGTAARAMVMLAAAAVLFAAALFPTGCGGGDGAAPQTSTGDPSARGDAPEDLDDWARQVQPRCQDLNERYADLARAAPTDREEAVAHAARVEDFAGDLVDTLAAVGVPPQRPAALGRFIELAGQLDAAAGQLATAAESGDRTAAAGAAAAVEELGERLNPLARELGVSACGGF